MAFIFAISFLLCTTLSVALYFMIPTWRAKHLAVSLMLSCTPMINTLLLIILAVLLALSERIPTHDKS